MVITHGGNLFSIAREHGWDWREVTDFSASINPLGPAPGVKQAIIDAMDRIVHYPDRYGEALCVRLAREWDVDPECILLGNGATDLIHFLARVWPHARVSLDVPTFSEFHRAYPRANGGGLRIIVRPNNPTGSAPEIPEDGPALIDESFIEFSDLPSAIGSGHVVLRSLTKFHALPGLRIGAVVGPADLVRQWREQREPWQVNVLAEAAALAALDDREHSWRTRTYVREERARLWNELARLTNVRPEPTHANFYFVRLAYRSSGLLNYFLQHRILIRDCTGWPGVEGEAVRFAIRTREENDRLLELWRSYPCD